MTLTITGAALLLHCSRSHLSRAIHGRLRDVPPLPSVRLGRRVLIRKQALKAWLMVLEQREQEAMRVGGLPWLRDDELEYIAGA